MKNAKNSYAFNKANYEGVLEEYELAFQWLESLNARVKPSRFGRYRKLLRKADSDNQSEDVNFVLQFINSQYEIESLVTIHKYLSGQYDEFVIRLLNDICSGPEEYVNENASSTNKSRNYIFELLVASKLVASGLKLDMSCESDVVTTVDNRKILIECKRLNSTKKIKQNVKDAITQIEVNRRKINSYGCRGIIALDVSKVINPSFGTLSINDIEELSILADMVEDFLNCHAALWCGKSPFVIGVIAYYSMMVLGIGDSCSLNNANQWLQSRISPVGTRSFRLFNQFGEFFTKGIIKQ